MGYLGQTVLPLTGASVDAPVTLPQGWHAGGPGLFAVLAAFVVAMFAYQAAQPFYNAMMPELVPPSEQGRLSGLGTAIGYVGSIFGVLLVAPFFNGVLPPGIHLGEGVLRTLHTIFPFTSHGGRVSTFLPTGVLFLLFTVPLIVFCRDHNPAPKGTPVNWSKAANT